MEAALIGLGKMGTGIAKSLLRAGHRVAVYNRTPSRAEALRADGAIVAATVSEACRSGIVLTMVADDAALEGLVFGEGGILASLPRGAVHISLSTISVSLSDRLSSEHARAGQGFLAAPVFGRPDAAEAGRLAVVVGGAETLVQKCKPLLEAMGAKLFVVGERPSMANVVKLSGNFLIASVLESLSEALAFARKSGVDAGALMEFLTATLFNAPVYKTYGDLIVQGKHEPAGFALPLGLKDVRLVLQAAEAANVPMPIASVVRDRFITAMARGNQDKDWSVIGRVAAEDAGLPQSARAAR
ncbi:MAG TPA: NAD(P)-dependent oxidoreductase [Candidatus Binatus sp.]|jgi:3-hydroxyisobutyrate dehydrogenase-like beta-hydroxyacid dehydrogenase|nr:NAD(P)-dependent oxidoreductase [Candidatus Binatus sp.]